MAVGGQLGNKNALGNDGGRPELYTEEWCKNEAKLFLNWMQKEDSIYYKTFAFERGYSAQRFHDFCKISVEFSEAMKVANEWQEQKLVAFALFNKTNASITKFVLSNKHQWSDKTVVVQEISPAQSTIAQSAGSTKDLIHENGSSDDHSQSMAETH